MKAVGQLSDPSDRFLGPSLFRKSLSGGRAYLLSVVDFPSPSEVGE